MNSNKMATVKQSTTATYSDKPAAQVNWHGPKISGHSALFCMYQMNPVMYVP